MSPTLRRGVQLLGKTGIAFLVALAFFSVFYLTGKGGLALLFALLSLPFGCILSFRALRILQRRGLWSVRNRLLFVYGLIGVLPLLLVVVLIGLGAWALTTELAIYLATSALDQRLTSLQYAVEALRRMPPDQQLHAAPEMLKGYKSSLPGLRLYIRDNTGLHRFPLDCPDLPLASGWGNVHGLLVAEQHFYGWAHFVDANEEIVAIAPLSDELVEDLVPNLGDITLFENPDETPGKRRPASAGSLRPIPKKGGSALDPDFDVVSSAGSAPGKTGRKTHFPPRAFRFDVPVGYASTISHQHLESPNKSYQGILLVNSRPSAVLGRFFSGTEFLRGVLFDAVVAVALLFLLVELAAAFVGARLARRLTGSVKALYEGTRRIINGDFSHRIPVLARDQLGELAGSFNQMTGNLERLLVIEKEKERLQTEIEIAREVQSQLYPKEAPPTCGVKLTVECDPARMVSGDYYDYQELAGKRLAFAIGDVAGKGISAALLMATLHASLRAQLTQYQPLRDTDCTDIPEPDVARMVSALNKQIFAHTSPEKYATFFFAVFDEKSRTLTYTNAGHLSPLLFRKDEVIPLDSNGIVVGAFAFAKYDESCLTLNSGDLLVCYTDGITEPENAYGEEFGEHRLIELVKKHYHRDDSEIVHIVLDAVRSWTGTPELHDDMTLLLAREVQPA
ncbi:MAG: SpoIIE family protein phosphatase [Acidobacteriota bacterium]|nr:SpoIIE family protein phosphatase [Acidobacteriota bacterium]